MMDDKKIHISLNHINDDKAMREAFDKIMSVDEFNNMRMQIIKKMQDEFEREMLLFAIEHKLETIYYVRYEKIESSNITTWYKFYKNKEEAVEENKHQMLQICSMNFEKIIKMDDHGLEGILATLKNNNKELIRKYRKTMLSTQHQETGKDNT